jgi:hypothetical protein
MKMLNGITHSIVSVRSKKDAAETGTLADVEIFFGNDSSIGGIRYVKNDKDLQWYTPVINILKDGKILATPVFTGPLMMEICRLSSWAIDRVRQVYGSPKWEAKYKIYRDQVAQIN